MRILLTGSTGFIGRHLTKILDESGYYCRCLVRNIGKASEIHRNHKKVDFAVGDILIPESLRGIADTIDAVIHLAATLGDYGKNERVIWDTNVGGTRNLLEEVQDVRQFIFCSTPGVQGLGHKQAREDFPYNPSGAYERSKAAAESLVIKLCEEKQIHWTSLRPDFVYGPGDVRRVLLYKRVHAGRMYVLGTGQTYISPTYVLDVVSAFANCINNESAFDGIFNVSGDPVTVKFFLETIAGNLNTSLPNVRIPSVLAIIGAVVSEFIYANILRKEPPVTPGKVKFLTQDHGTDNKKARMLLDFHQDYPLDQGMKKTITWYKEKGMIESKRRI